MSILNKVKEARKTAGPIIEKASKYAQVTDALFGKKERVPVPQIERRTEDDYEEENQNDKFEDQYNQPPEYEQSDREELARTKDYLRRNEIDISSEFNKDRHSEYSNERLRSMAKLKVQKLYLTADLKTEPLRIAASYLCTKLGKHEIAEELKTIDLNEGFEDFKEMLEEVIYYELKDLQRAKKLRMPSASELMEFKVIATLQKIAGDGFKNVIELGEAGYEKVAKKKK